MSSDCASSSAWCTDDALLSELPPLVDEDEQSGDDLMDLSKTPTCNHNQWVRVSRMTGTVVSLQCRVCGSDWETDLEWHTKCTEHFAGRCDKGGDCPHAHIYRVQSKRRKAWKKAATPTTSPIAPAQAYPTQAPVIPQQFIYFQQPATRVIAYPPTPAQVVLLSLPQALHHPY